MKISHIFFIIYEIIIVFIFAEDSTNSDIECPRDKPLLNKTNNICVYDFYNENKHIISNNILKEQWLNRRNPIGINETRYMNSDFSSNGDLIIESFSYLDGRAIDIRYLYGIKSNGRPLFYDEEKKEFTYKINITTKKLNKYESQLIKINLKGDNEKDYYLSPSFSNYSIDIIDIYNKDIINFNQADLFGFSVWSSKYFNAFKLSNEDKTYLFCFLGRDPPTGNFSKYYLSLQKFQFYNLDLSQNQNYKKINSTTIKDDLKVQRTGTLTCFEIVKYLLIQCFYINIDSYLTIGLFNESNLELMNSTIIEETPVYNNTTSDTSQFHKSILLKDEISVLCYRFENNSFYSYLQIKNVKYDNKNSTFEIEDYLNFHKIKLNRNNTMNFGVYYYINNILKINDHRFTVISPSKNNYELFLVVFKII